MKRFVLALFCTIILAGFSLTALADDASKEKEAKKADQVQKDQGAEEDAAKEGAAEKDVKKDKAQKESEKDASTCDKKENVAKAEKKDDAKKGKKDADKKCDAGKAGKKDAAKKDTNKKKDEVKTIEVKKDELHLCVDLKGVFEARKATPIKLEAKQWSNFKILRAVEHGTKVSRGDLLIAFDPEDIDEAIANGRRTLAMARIGFKKSEKEYETVKKLLPTEQAKMARAMKEMFEDQKWKETHDWMMDDEVREMVARVNEYRRDSAREEYRQLKKMYDADDITEETEEIILKRTKLEMDVAELMYKMDKNDYDFEKKYGIDREKREREEGKLKNKLSTELAVALFPMMLEMKKLAMEKERIEFNEVEKKFKELLADRELMTVKAPCDGVVYYGFCTNGKWNGATAGTLEKDASVPPKKVFMTIVGTDQLQVRSSVSEKELAMVREGLKATARATALPETQLQLLIDEVDSIPSGGSFEVLLKVVGETPEILVPGMSCDIKAIGFHKKDALVVPAGAIETDPLDDAKQFVYQVDKKGKSKKVQIKTGKTIEGKVEVLDGLKAGDKILPKPPVKDEKK